MRIARRKGMAFYEYVHRIYAHIQIHDRLEQLPDKVVYLLTTDVDALIFADDVSLRDQWRMFVSSIFCCGQGSQGEIALKENADLI